MNSARGTRKAQAARRREQLLEAALALFSERGYRTTSVRDITRAAGVTEAVLYHYFANKVDLWTAVLVTYAPFGHVAQILDEVGGDPTDAALRRVGSELLRLLRARAQLVLTLLSEAPAEPDVAAVLERFLENVATELAAFLAERQAAGEIARAADPETAARAFQGALLARFLTTSLAQHPVDAAADHAAVVRLVAVLWDGLRPWADAGTFLEEAEATGDARPD